MGGGALMEVTDGPAVPVMVGAARPCPVDTPKDYFLLPLTPKAEGLWISQSCVGVAVLLLC